MKFAGDNLAKHAGWLLTDSLGEEVLEGTLGGVIAGASQLGTDQPLGQTALETAAAIAGGIGMGMLGRRIGARIGKKMHADPLKDQQGMLATVGRSIGSETTVEGLKSQGAMMKTMVQEGLVNETSARMVREAMESPAAFAAKYGVDAQSFQEILPLIHKGRTAAGVAETVQGLPIDQRERLMMKVKDYVEVENILLRETAENMDRVVIDLADKTKGVSVEGFTDDVGKGLMGLLATPAPVTGEHIGRATGRVLGDEVGVLGGLAGGSVLANALGFESSKDRTIRDLEEQLALAG